MYQHLISASKPSNYVSAPALCIKTIKLCISPCSLHQNHQIMYQHLISASKPSNYVSAPALGIKTIKLRISPCSRHQNHQITYQPMPTTSKRTNCVSTPALCIKTIKLCITLCSPAKRLRDREVACSASDRQGSNFESCVWRTVSSQSSHHPQEVLLPQFSQYVHKGGLKPDSFHFFSIKTIK